MKCGRGGGEAGGRSTRLEEGGGELQPLSVWDR